MTRYKALEASYETYFLRYQEINTLECIVSLQEWYKKPRVKKSIYSMTANEIEAYIFPEIGQCVQL